MASKPKTPKRPKVAKKWIRTEADKEAIRKGYWFDEIAAAWACSFFPTFLRHPANSSTPGVPFDLLPWQADLVSRMYGWKRPDGRRRFREVYCEVPKKNGKSGMLSGLGLLAMIDEPGAGVYQGAVDKEQAEILFLASVEMVEASPELSAIFTINRHRSTITWRETKARMVCMSSEVDKKDGINSSFTVIDEVHRLIGKRRELYDIMKLAGRSRRNPFLVAITTAGFDKKSLCWELHTEARRIIDGATDNLRFLGVIYAASPDDDLDDPAVWRKANPSMGTILSEEDFADDWAEAKRIPGRRNNFLRLGFNIWTNAETAWLPLPLWDARADPYPLAAWKGRVLVGVDLATKFDLCAMTLCMMDGDVAQWHSLYFMPEDLILPKSQAEAVPYDRWADEGWITPTPGSFAPFEPMIAKLVELREAGMDIQMVGVDRWNMVHFAQKLITLGFETVLITQQGFGSWTGPCGELDRRLSDGSLAHDGSPVTRFCAENVVLEQDPIGNVRPSKTKSTRKIDGIVSGLMALGLATGHGYHDETGGAVAL